MHIEPKAEDVKLSIRESFKNSIINLDSQRTETGNLFFTVSSGTIGLFITLFKIDGRPISLNYFLFFSFLFLFISTIISVLIIKPYNLNIEKDNINLFCEYKKQVKTIRKLLNRWLLFWILGLLFGIIELFILSNMSNSIK